MSSFEPLTKILERVAEYPTMDTAYPVKREERSVIVASLRYRTGERLTLSGLVDILVDVLEESGTILYKEQAWREAISSGYINPIPVEDMRARPHPIRDFFSPLGADSTDTFSEGSKTPFNGFCLSDEVLYFGAIKMPHKGRYGSIDYNGYCFYIKLVGKETDIPLISFYVSDSLNDIIVSTNIAFNSISLSGVPQYTCLSSCNSRDIGVDGFTYDNLAVTGLSLLTKEIFSDIVGEDLFIPKDGSAPKKGEEVCVVINSFGNSVPIKLVYNSLTPVFLLEYSSYEKAVLKVLRTLMGPSENISIKYTPSKSVSEKKLVCKATPMEQQTTIKNIEDTFQPERAVFNSLEKADDLRLSPAQLYLITGILTSKFNITLKEQELNIKS